MNEIISNFKEIPFIPGYFVSKKGEIKGLKKIIKPDRGGYKNKYLRFSAYGKKYYLHQVMLKTFIGDRPEGMEACHNDGNTLNNSIVNLRWDTPLNNSRDRILHNNNGNGEKNAMAKIKDIEADFIVLNYHRFSTFYLAEKFKISNQSISGIVSGRIRFNCKHEKQYEMNKEISKQRMLDSLKKCRNRIKGENKQ